MNILETILTVILIGGGVIYLAACLAAFWGYFRPRHLNTDYIPSISVIIAARNEEKNISNLLSDLLKQDYPYDSLEIIVVDDFSEDGTRTVVEKFIAVDDRVHLVETRSSRSPYTHKKKAVHEGILSSAGEIIMTVDADCRVQKGWVSGMVKHLAPGVDFVAGEVIVDGSGFPGWLEALEFTGIQMMAAGLMNARFPVTCNGANLAYRRSAFVRVNGFDGVGTLVSGDDDLLMQKIVKGRPSAVVFASGTHTAVRVRAQSAMRDFLTKRTRWASKILAYPSHLAVGLLFVFFVFFAALILWLVSALIGVVDIMPFIIGYALKTAGDILLTGYGTVRNGRAWLLFLFPLAEILHVPYIVGVTLKGLFGSFEWHGRRTGAASVEYRETLHD